MKVKLLITSTKGKCARCHDWPPEVSIVSFLEGDVEKRVLVSHDGDLTYEHLYGIEFQEDGVVENNYGEVLFRNIEPKWVEDYVIQAMEEFNNTNYLFQGDLESYVRGFLSAKGVPEWYLTEGKQIKGRTTWSI